MIILWIYISLKPNHWKCRRWLCLIILWIYISLKPDGVTVRKELSLIILWIYISLKLAYCLPVYYNSLIILWIYISLKLTNTNSTILPVWLSFEFTYLSNRTQLIVDSLRFDYPLNLHISQTALSCLSRFFWFDYPLNLHISQTTV